MLSDDHVIIINKYGYAHSLISNSHRGLSYCNSDFFKNKSGSVFINTLEVIRPLDSFTIDQLAAIRENIEKQLERVKKAMIEKRLEHE